MTPPIEQLNYKYDILFYVKNLNLFSFSSSWVVFLLLFLKNKYKFFYSSSIDLLILSLKFKNSLLKFNEKFKDIIKKKNSNNQVTIENSL